MSIEGSKPFDAAEIGAGAMAETVAALREQVLTLGRRDAQDVAHWNTDDTLHLMFPEALNNGVMLRMIRQLRMTTRLFELTSPAGRVAADAAEHVAILDAFAKGDARRARASMVTHLRNVVAEILDVVSGGGMTSHRRKSRP